jgi:hypothetical protein
VIGASSQVDDKPTDNLLRMTFMQSQDKQDKVQTKPTISITAKSQQVEIKQN